MWTLYTQCVNSAYTVYNSKYCLPKSTNAEKKEKRKKKGKRKTLKTQTPNSVESKRPHNRGWAAEFRDLLTQQNS